MTSVAGCRFYDNGMDLAGPECRRADAATQPPGCRINLLVAQGRLIATSDAASGMRPLHDGIVCACGMSPMHGECAPLFVVCMLPLERYHAVSNQKNGKIKLNFIAEISFLDETNLLCPTHSTSDFF